MRKFKKLPKIINARKFRKKPTKAEKLLWEHLRDRKLLGKKFRRQHIIKGFILDFYCFEDRLGIELDGGIHLGQKEQDQARENVVADMGIRIIRFKNENILSNINEALAVIKMSLSFPSPSMMEKDMKDQANN